MWGNITLWVLALYISLFVLETLRHRQWLWLWAAVLLWATAAVAGHALLPGILGPRQLINAYLPQLYVGLAALPAAVLAWRPHGDRRGWQWRNGGDYLALLAVSSLLQLAAFALLAVLVRWHYPTGLSLYVWPGMLYLFALQPVYWIGSQWLLMALFYLHRRGQGQSANRFSRLQLQGGFLLALLLQSGFLLADLLTRYAPQGA